MTEAVFTLESIILFLGVGVGFGAIFLLMKVMKIVLGIKKIGEAVLDIILCLISTIVIFLCALALDGGKIRLLQLLLHGIGALAVIWLLDPLVQGMARMVSKFGKNIKKFIFAKFKKISAKKKKKKASKKQLQKTANAKKAKAKLKKHRTKVKKEKKRLEKQPHTGI